MAYNFETESSRRVLVGYGATEDGRPLSLPRPNPLHTIALLSERARSSVASVPQRTQSFRSRWYPYVVHNEYHDRDEKDLLEAIILLVLICFLLLVIALPLTSLVIALVTRRKLNERIARLEAATGITPTRDSEEQLQQLTARIQRLEARLATGQVVTQPAVDTEPEPKTEPIEKPQFVPPPAQPKPIRPSTFSALDLESMIGRQWIGWIAVTLILFATAFFLKYAFDNRWIGEVGRVAIGTIFGVTMTALGYRYHRRRWKVFSQILTGGGIVLLYLSDYAAFGYYHLVPQKAAFIFLAMLIAQAATLAILYSAPPIAIMALIGGFLTPLLLHSDRDQYVSLFAYLIAIDIGALAVLKHWRGLRTIAFLGTHILFWLWYDQNYHEQRRFAVLVFHLVVFSLFLVSHIALRFLRRQESTSFEAIYLLAANAFVFFATTYHLFNPTYHDWMGVFAIVMAIVYAGVAKLLFGRHVSGKMEALTLVGISLTFVTIAIPIQLRANWITIAWAVEALAMLWAGIQVRSQRLRITACLLFALSMFRLLFWDTAFNFRPQFTPIFNQYFLSSVIVIGCVFAAAALYKRFQQPSDVVARRLYLTFLLVGMFGFWVISSVEVVTYFQAKAFVQRVAEDARQQEWLGQMSLSVLWAIYAATLAAIGLIRRSSITRWAALSLFALTTAKVMLVDISDLERLYRILVFFVLGILLLLVSWGYQRLFHARESTT